MRVDELVRILKEAYEKAPNLDKSAAVCLFGIRCAGQIGSDTNAIISKAGIGNYGLLLRMGKKLARDVRPR